MKRKIAALFMVCMMAISVPVFAEEAPEVVNVIPGDTEEIISQFPEPTGVGTPMGVKEIEELNLEEEFANEPFLPEGLEEYVPDKSILGNDDRINVSDPWMYPYSPIAYLVVKFQCGCYCTGSGFMISSHGMLTASHCLICVEHGTEPEYIDYYFGCQNPDNYAYSYHGGFHYWWGTGFLNHAYTDNELGNDYGFIKFDENIGDTTGWLGTKALNDDQWKTGYFTVTGYRDGRMTTNSGFGDTCFWDNRIAEFTMDTLPGNSGCPIIDTTDGYAVGICIAENDVTNYAYRLNGNLFGWMRDDGIF